MIPRFKHLRTQPSGLFIRRCVDVDCGQQLILNPLHAVVMTAFYLTRFGAPGEDLFGILAVFLCLVRTGLDPLLESEISVAQILQLGSETSCDHTSYTAAEFARAVSDELFRTSCITGRSLIFLLPVS